MQAAATTICTILSAVPSAMAEVCTDEMHAQFDVRATANDRKAGAALNRVRRR